MEPELADQLQLLLQPRTRGDAVLVPLGVTDAEALVTDLGQVA